MAPLQSIDQPNGGRAAEQDGAQTLEGAPHVTYWSLANFVRPKEEDEKTALHASPETCASGPIALGFRGGFIAAHNLFALDAFHTVLEDLDLTLTGTQRRYLQEASETSGSRTVKRF